MKILKGTALVALLATVGLTSCKKEFLDRKPTGQAALEDVFTSVSGARAAVNGIHRMMYEFGGDQHYEFGQPSINMMFDLMGEDFIQNGQGHFNPVYNWNASRSASATGGYMWSFYFRMINNANFVIDNIDAVPGDINEKEEVKAQALFYRAYAYYNLANCYSFSYKYTRPGGVSMAGNNGVEGYNGNVLGMPCVPIYDKPTQVPNPRSTVEQVYAFMTKDVDSAIAKFDRSGVSRGDKSQIDGSVARGLGARIALVKQEWAKAALLAREARSAYSYMNKDQALAGFNDVNNNEWMWGSAINAEQATSYASYLSFMDRQAGGYALVHCQMVVLNEIVNTWLDTNDVRKQWWLTRDQVANDPRYKGIYRQYEQLKFKGKVKGTWLADYPLMRAGEMALIEAEALAQQGSLAQAATTLEDFIKTRNPLFTATTTSKDALVQQIWKERRVELWGEGFRYIDIKRQSAKMAGVTEANGLVRLGNVGQVGVNVRTVTADSYQWLFRIPTSEILQNKQMLQNPSN